MDSRPISPGRLQWYIITCAWVMFGMMVNCGMGYQAHPSVPAWQQRRGEYRRVEPATLDGVAAAAQVRTDGREVMNEMKVVSSEILNQFETLQNHLVDNFNPGSQEELARLRTYIEQSDVIVKRIVDIAMKNSELISQITDGLSEFKNSLDSQAQTHNTIMDVLSYAAEVMKTMISEVELLKSTHTQSKDRVEAVFAKIERLYSEYAARSREQGAMYSFLKYVVLFEFLAVLAWGYYMQFGSKKRSSKFY